MSTNYLAVQLIQLRYTDDDRGHEHAENRERVRACVLPAIEGDGVFHDCRAEAWRDFELWTMTSGLPWRAGRIYLHGLMLWLEDGRLAIGLDPGAETWKSKRIRQVAEGEWARVVWNEKDGDAETKWLVQLVLNVGLFARPPGGEIFFGSPTRHQDLRRDFLRNAYR